MRRHIERIRTSYRARPLPPKILIWLIVLVVVGLMLWLANDLVNRDPVVNDFKSCVAAGNPVLESFPEQCVHEGQSYINPDQNIPHPFEQQ